MGDYQRDPEIIIGIVGKIGTDIKVAVDLIKQCLNSLCYSSHHIKLTDFLAQGLEGISTAESPLEERYKSYISACNKVREKTKRNDIFISYAVESIKDIRSTENAPEGGTLPRAAFIINQLKRPEEVSALREIYGQQFILISCHTSREEREESLARKFSNDHPHEPRQSHWRAEAQKLIERDDKEVNVPSGQRVSDIFPLADLIIDPSRKDFSEKTLRRFFWALFGDFRVSPTRPEFFQNIAYQVALTSCDTARQVGAAIELNGAIASTGYNEAPRAFGGTYWPEDGKDARDVALGQDINTIRKRQMVTEIIDALRPYMTNQHSGDVSLASKLIDGPQAPLKNIQIMDSLEFGRAVHAEMSAITSAARVGTALEGGTLYCTTFPCHNCSKHIVATGLRKVVFLEPYAKSFSEDLYPDSIRIDPAKDGLERDQVGCEDKVVFEQFVGITPVRFDRIFLKSRMKDAKGKVIDWNPLAASPRFLKVDQDHLDRETIYQKILSDRLDQEAKIFLRLQDET